MAALDKVGSQYLRTEFRRDARRFLEECVNCVLLTVASRSVLRPDLSCFCPAIVVGGDDDAPLQLINKLLDGLLEKVWIRGSEVEACRAEYQSFVHEQWQLERSSTRNRPDLGDVLSFCFAQAGFCAPQQLHKVCIVSNQTCCFHFYELSRPPQELLPFQMFQLTTLVIRSPATHGEKFIVGLDCVPIKKEEVRSVLGCVQDFVRCPHCAQRNFFSESGLTMLSESVAFADSITSSSVYAPWSVVESTCVRQVITDLCACWHRVVLRRRTAKDTSERWYHGGTPQSEAASKTGVRTSDNIEEGRVEYVPVTSPALGPPGSRKNRSSHIKRKKKISQSPVKLRRSFETSSPPAGPQRRSLKEDTSFASVLAAPASAGSRVGVGVIIVPPQYFNWAFHRDNLL